MELKMTVTGTGAASDALNPAGYPFLNAVIELTA